MSLHLGNLSPRIRKDELERVFRRFGRCTVRLKDGYGFAVYDFRGNAEAALRALKGRKICGQTIDLSWSNKQPKPLQRFARAARSHDMMQHGRNSDRNDNHVGHNLSGSHGGRHMSTGTGLREDRVSFDHNSKDSEHYNQNEEFIEEGDRIEPNQVDAGWWDEEAHKLGNGNDVDEQMGFDRYEPDCGDEGIVEDDENHDLRHLADSPSGQTSLDKYQRIQHLDNTRGHQTCFKCGAAGHRMRDCLPEGALHGRKSYHTDHRHEKEAKSRALNEVGGLESRSRERLRLSNIYPRSARQHETERKNGTMHSSAAENKSNQTKKKTFNRKKRREREDQTLEGLNDRKSWRLASSHLHSDHTSPKLSTHSRSLEPLSGSGSQYGSRSPLPHSLSVSSRSKSKSYNSRSRSMKSKSGSRSHSRSSSLSVFRGQSIPSPPLNEERVNLNGSLNGPQIPHSKEVLTEINKLFEPDDGEESFPMENRTDASIENQELELDFVDEDHISGNCSDASLNGSLEEEQIRQSPEVILEERQGDRDATAEELLLEKQRVAEELESTEAEKTIKSMEPVNISDPSTPSNSHIGCHLSISTEELKRVLKHYGLKHPDEHEQPENVEDYFGSARLWPWEMIYYRRYKKGLVSAENYARRVAQNTAFGIVDKYIRSSSGWFESIEELP